MSDRAARKARDKELKRLQQQRRLAREMASIRGAAAEASENGGPDVVLGFPGADGVVVSGSRSHRVPGPAALGRMAPSTSGSRVEPSPSSCVSGVHHPEDGLPATDWGAWRVCQVCGESAVGCPACYVRSGVVLGWSKHGKTAVFGRTGRRAVTHGTAGTFVSQEEAEAEADAGTVGAPTSAFPSVHRGAEGHEVVASGAPSAGVGGAAPALPVSPLVDGSGSLRAVPRASTASHALPAEDLFGARKRSSPGPGRSLQIPDLVDRRRILDRRSAWPAVTVVIHDPVRSTTTSLRVAPDDPPDALALMAAVACGRSASAPGALLVPAAAGPVILWSRPPGASSVAALSDVVRSAPRRWIHTLAVPRPLGRATSALVSAFLLKSMGPERGEAWFTAPRSDLDGIGPQFPDRDSVQSQLDWLLRQSELVRTRGAGSAAGSLTGAGAATGLAAREARRAADTGVNLRRVDAGQEHLLGAPKSIMRAHKLRA